MIRYWRHNPDDVDNIVKYFKALKKGVEATVFKSGNSISVRLPKVIADLYHLNTSLKLPIEKEPQMDADERRFNP
jgi:hypothetical protein